MRKLIIIILALVELCFSVPAFAESTNQVATNQVQQSGTSTNTVIQHSDTDLQAAAQDVWYKLILLGLLVLIGGLVVAGFAIYGAYKAFGIVGVIGIVILIALGVFAVGGILIQAF